MYRNLSNALIFAELKMSKMICHIKKLIFSNYFTNKGYKQVKINFKVTIRLTNLLEKKNLGFSINLNKKRRLKKCDDQCKKNER